MKCKHVQHELMELLARGEDLAGPLADHVGACSDCREAWEDLAFSMGRLDSLPRQPVPAGLAESVRLRVVQDLKARPRTHFPAELGLALGFGLLAALVSLAVLGFRIDPNVHPTWAIATGGIAWAAMFVLAFWLLLRPRPAGESTRSLVLSGLGALAVFMVADQLFPLTKAVQLCYRSSWAQDYFGAAGLQSFFFVLGGVYAVLPLFLFSLATAKRYRSGPLKGGLLAGGIFFLLLAPAIFIQCSAFTAGAFLAWLAGAALGATAGGVAGYWVYRHALAHRA